MEVVTLPLPPSLRSKLIAAGLYTTTDLLNITPLQLALGGTCEGSAFSWTLAEVVAESMSLLLIRSAVGDQNEFEEARLPPQSLKFRAFATISEVNITNEEALSILKLVPQSGTAFVSAFKGSKTAWDLLLYEKNRKKIVTSCTEVDAILGGGLCAKEVTEICGVPGVGKTQLGMQLAINVQIPANLGGIGGHAIYIDTEGSFMVERALQMTEACIADLLHAKPADSNIKLEVDDFLSHIYLLRVHNPTEQLAVINTLPKLLNDHQQVKLIVIDSVTFNFRQDFDDMAGRTRLLADMAQKLMAIAEKHDVAILLTNQVTHKVTNEGSKMVPALGESWSHACTNRVLIYWMDGVRYARVVKSPSLPSATAAFGITEEGVREAHQSNKRPKLDEAHNELTRY